MQRGTQGNSPGNEEREREREGERERELRQRGESASEEIGRAHV